MFKIQMFKHDEFGTFEFFQPEADSPLEKKLFRI